jgi:hypothetical protein
MAGLELMEGSHGELAGEGKEGEVEEGEGARLGSARELLGELGAGCPILLLLALCYVLNVRKETGRRKDKKKKRKEKKRKKGEIFQT